MSVVSSTAAVKDTNTLPTPMPYMSLTAACVPYGQALGGR